MRKMCWPVIEQGKLLTGDAEEAEGLNGFFLLSLPKRSYEVRQETPVVTKR